MYEFYHQTVPTAVQKVTRRSLRNLYEAIPDTEGCIENINKDSGCGGWCCQIQNPQVMFSEFLLTWNQITHNWTKSQLIDLICRAISSYIDTKPTKGCVFWDSQTKLCGQHETRPFNCRTYAQVPEEDFKPRFEALKILYQDQPDADLRNQCGLVKTVGKKPTTADIDSWFAELTLIERDFGIRQSLINVS
jgi:Fe-S-cluster containining protein